MKKLVVVVAALVIALTACGGGGDSSKSKDAISSELKKNGLSSTQSSCIANAFVDKLGTDTLVKYGLLKKGGDVSGDSSLTDVKMSKGDADKAADALSGCIHFSDLMKLSGQDSGLTDSVISCLNDKVSDDDFKTVMAGIFSGDTAATAGITADIQACVTAG